MDDNKWEIIAKKLSGELDNQEQEEFEQWLLESPKNLAEFTRATEVWEKSNGKGDFSPDVDAAWNKFSRRISRSKEAGGTEKGRIFRLGGNSGFSYALKIAAVLLLVAGLFFVIAQVFPEFSKNNMTASAGEIKEVVLPDGSKVWINSGSTLSWPDEFTSDERLVSLEGEAYFQVAKDASKPFRISANGTVTEVLGTEFNLNAAEKNEYVVLSLVEGKVSFNSKKTEEAVILTPGEEGVFNLNTKNLTKQPIADPNFLAWKTKTLKFNSASLPQVLQTLENYYGVEINRTAEAENCTFTGTFRESTLEETLEILQIALKMEYDLKGEKVTITKLSCKQINQ